MAHNYPKISINQRKLSVNRTCNEWPLAYETEHKAFVKMKGKCKSLCIAERKLRNKRRKSRVKGLWYRVDPDDPRQLILRNGTLLRQPIEGVCLYISIDGRVYSLTKFGLRERSVDCSRKKNYGKKIKNGTGCHQGQVYPRVKFHNKNYPAHIMMARAWKGGIGLGMVPDHIDGNIDNYAYDNIRVVTVEENYRCGGILKRLRYAAKKYDLPEMDPVNMKPKELLGIYERMKGLNRQQMAEAVLREVHRVMASRK